MIWIWIRPMSSLLAWLMNRSRASGATSESNETTLMPWARASCRPAAAFRGLVEFSGGGELLSAAASYLVERKFDLVDVLTTLSKFTASLAEGIASGPYFKVMLVNLAPYWILQPFVDAGVLRREGPRLRLNREGMLVANEIMAVFV